MTDSEKPLRVQVAEALGWIRTRPDALEIGAWRGVEPEFGQVETIPRYDTDWSATGPLIEKYRFWVQPASPTKGDDGRGNTWQDYDWNADAWREQKCTRGYGSTPLIAVCNLILTLAEAGKLKAK